MMATISRIIGGIRRFSRKQDGLVTVEWVALAAGMVVAAIGVSFVLMNSLKSQASTVPGNISTTVNDVYTGFATP
jgi:Flp pilus assembly pilin Flp